MQSGFEEHSMCILLIINNLQDFNSQNHFALAIINCNWGGTNIEAWMRAAPKTFPVDSMAWSAFNTKQPYLAKPNAVLYNAMLYPLHVFSVAGSIWYQGESNVLNARYYKTYLHWMVQDWRLLFGNNMPFYYAQIAPFKYKKNFTGALLQEQQRMAMHEIDKVGMVVTADIAGDVHDIHPKNKLDVGERLARWALANTYKKKKIAVSGPIYSSMRTEGDKIRIKFEYAENGLQLRGDTVANLEIAGANNAFIKAIGKVEGNDLLVYHPNITSPQAVRMAFNDTAIVNLYNAEGLPAAPFRTDNFPVLADIDYTISVNNDHSKTIALFAKDTVCYTLDGTAPGKQSAIYTTPINTAVTATLKARTIRNNVLSSEEFQKNIVVRKGHVLTNVELLTRPDKKYAANGALSLHDGESGSNTHADNTWLGFQASPVSIKIDLGAEKAIQAISIGLLQSQQEWIFLPQHTTVFVSDDGINFKEIATGTGSWNRSDEIEFTEQKIRMPAGIRSRYIKLELKNKDKIPEWHHAKGNVPWIFMDELSVE